MSKVSRRAAGVSFMAIAAFLLAAKYLTAATFGSGVQSWSKGLFDAMLEYVGYTLNIASGIAVLIGVFYLVIAEKEENQNGQE